MATLVSFLVASFILKTSKQEDDDFEESVKKSKEMKSQGKQILNAALIKPIQFVAFACDAGLGSSAMGASAFRKRVEKEGLEVTVKNYAIEKVPQEADVIVTHKNLLGRTSAAWPEKRIVTIENFMKDVNIEELLEELVEQKAKL